MFKRHSRTRQRDALGTLVGGDGWAQGIRRGGGRTWDASTTTLLTIRARFTEPFEAEYTRHEVGNARLIPARSPGEAHGRLQTGFVCGPLLSQLANCQRPMTAPCGSAMIANLPI